jgi:hypothetical protein
MKDLRLARAQRILASVGLATRVSVTGHADDVLSVQAPIAQLRGLQALAPGLKRLGFRYVALELAPEEQREPR